MLELRILAPTDWRVWRYLRLAALAEAPYAFGSTLADWRGEGDREERWRDRLDIPGSHDVVAVLDGGLVGMASGVPAETPDVVELVSMWVSPVARGQGVGEALLGEVERWAGQVRARTLRLAVMPDNVPALALYERWGFKDAKEPGDMLPDGERGERVMAKALHTSC